MLTRRLEDLVEAPDAGPFAVRLVDVGREPIAPAVFPNGSAEGTPVFSAAMVVVTVSHTGCRWFNQHSVANPFTEKSNAMNTEIEGEVARPAKKRRSVRRRLAQTALAMSVPLGVVAVSATPAFAAISTCTIWWPGPGSCTTGAVPPHGGGTWVDWRVSGGAFGSTSWYMYDVSNGIHVAAGNVPAGQTYTGTVFGLYNPSGYQIHISSSYAGFATIENELP